MANFPNVNDANYSSGSSRPALSPASASSLQPVSASENPGETYPLTGPSAKAPSEFDGSSMKTSVTRATASEADVPPVKRLAKNSLWILIGCNVLVFMSSVCVMVLELTASRLIAKHVGSSLYMKTSTLQPIRIQSEFFASRLTGGTSASEAVAPVTEVFTELPSNSDGAFADGPVSR